MIKGRSRFGATTGLDGRVYAIGGPLVLDGSSTSEVFDPANPGQGWKPLPLMNLAPAGRNQAAAATGSDGRIYAFGSNLYDMVSVEAYNPDNNLWEPMIPLPGGTRSGLAAVGGPCPGPVVRSGCVYAMGGGAVVTPNVDVYDPQNPAAGWVAVAPMTTPRSLFSAAVGSDNRIYAVGGGPFGSGATMEAYDPATNTWALVAPLPDARTGVAATAGPDGRIYAIGGQLDWVEPEIPSSQNYRSSVNVYDPEFDRWTPVAPMSIGRDNAAATLGGDGRIYALGGGNSDGFQRPVAEAYNPGPKPPPPPPEVEPDPVADTWVPGKAMGSGRQFAGATTGPDGRLYVLGGESARAEAYDPTTRRWSPLPAMSVARSHVAAAAGPDGRIYAIGGYTATIGTFSAGPYLNLVEAYDPTRPELGWVRVAPMLVPRSSLAAVTGPDGLIYALGGTGQQTVETYDYQSDTWTPGTNMTVARSGFGAAVGNDGRIYAVGGNTKTVEAYDTISKTWAPAASTRLSRQDGVAVAGPDGRIYAFGGSSSEGRVVEVYDPRDVARGWTDVTPMSIARPGVSTAASNGRIYALGGAISGRISNSTEIYTPGAPRVVVGPTDAPPRMNPPFVEYPISQRPISVASGSDGNVWFTLDRAIGRMTPDGKYTYFALAAASSVSDIAAGPDGNMWFTRPQSNKVGKITPTGVVTEFDLPLTLTSLSTASAGPRKIAAGPDGNMWFTHPGANRIGRINPTTGVIADYLLPTPNSSPTAITSGPDGNLWFTMSSTKLGRITPVGAISEFEFAPPPATPTAFPVPAATDIAAGAGNKIWFTIAGAFRTPGKLGQIDPLATDPGATFRQFALTHGDGTTVPTSIASGSDGNMWVVDAGGDIFAPKAHKLLRVEPVAPTVRVTVFPVPQAPDDNGKLASAQVGDIAAYSAGQPYMAFTETAPNGIGRLDIGGQGTFTYRPGIPEAGPGEHCVGSGDPAASQIKTRTMSCTITSSGPLTQVVVSRDLNCQVWHELDTAGEHYVDGASPPMPEGRAGDGECGTFLVADDVLYGPKQVPCFYYMPEPSSCANSVYGKTKTPDKSYELISQDGVFGSGTIKDPYAIVTQMRAGHMLLTQTDSYIVGRESYRTDVTVTNTSDKPSKALLTRAGDCWLANSDGGGGRYTPASGAVACTSNPGFKGSTYTDPASAVQTRIIEWTPISPGSRWAVGDRVGIWHLVGYKKPFVNSCVDGAINAFDPAYYVDYANGSGPRPDGPGNADDCGGENGAGLSWDFTLAPDESTTRSHYTTFSPFGNSSASIGDAAAVSEPATGTTTANFEVKLAHPAGRAVTLKYTASDKAAVAGTDYEPTTGKVVIPAGQTSATISVPVLADDEFESTEDFEVQIADADEGIVDDPLVTGLGKPDVNPDDPQGSGFANAQPVLITDGDALGTIVDLPPVPELSVSDQTVTELTSGPVTAAFTVDMSRPSPRAVSFDVATGDRSAIADSDYSPVSRRVEIPAGETRATIVVDVAGDTVVEGTEDFMVHLASPTDANLKRGTAIGTILDAEVAQTEEPIPTTTTTTTIPTTTSTVPTTVPKDEPKLPLKVDDPPTTPPPPTFPPASPTSPTPGPDPTPQPPTSPAVVVPPLLALAPLPPLPGPPQPLPQPLTQAQAQQQAQQQSQQQAQQQSQQQAQQQAQAQAQGQVQAQAQVGMTAERQKEVQGEQAYVVSRGDGTSLATTPVLGWVAALLAGAVALTRGPGTSPTPARQENRTRPAPGRPPRRRRIRH